MLPEPVPQPSTPAAQSNAQNFPKKYSVGPTSLQVKEFRLRVSSLRLTSSSLYFKTMLEGARFREGQELAEKGFIEIELLEPKDDPTAIMIIMGILYGTDVDVPNHVDLATLEGITILVDKFQWHTLVTPHATAWFDNLIELEGRPNRFDKNLLVWLFIAWQFGIQDDFKYLSKVAQQDSPTSIDTHDESIRLSTRIIGKSTRFLELDPSPNLSEYPNNIMV